jgi:hypothetical protein
MPGRARFGHAEIVQRGPELAQRGDGPRGVLRSGVGPDVEVIRGARSAEHGERVGADHEEPDVVTDERA